MQKEKLVRRSFSEGGKKWGKPKPIILTRGKPEERLLAVCKLFSPDGPGTVASGCFNLYGADCIQCYSFGGSGV